MVTFSPLVELFSSARVQQVVYLTGVFAPPSVVNTDVALQQLL